MIDKNEIYNDIIRCTNCNKTTLHLIISPHYHGTIGDSYTANTNWTFMSLSGKCSNCKEGLGHYSKDVEYLKNEVAKILQGFNPWEKHFKCNVCNIILRKSECDKHLEICKEIIQ